MDSSHTSCQLCQPGTGPNTNRNGCVDCDGNTFSISGECEECPPGTVASEGKQGCNDISQGQLSDVSVVAEVLEAGSNVVPQVTLALALDDVDPAALVEGSPEQVSLAGDLALEMSSALGLDPESVEVINIRLASQDDGRRRAQQAEELLFDLVIDDPNVEEVLTDLVEQIQDPTSALMTSSIVGNIDPDMAPVFSFVCPIGMYRPIGDANADCMYCEGNSVPDEGTNFGSCRDCLPGLAPDPTTRSVCVCDASHYDATLGEIKCYEEGQKWGAIESQSGCLPCADLDCVTCALDGTIGEPGAAFVVQMNAGFSLSSTNVEQGVSFAAIHGQRAVFPCAAYDETCTGDLSSPCTAAYQGPLCSYCAEGYSRSGLQGECTE
eukprot:COSAG05_NODE_4693_length_1407_cov_1.469419_1_plen_379_part_10